MARVLELRRVAKASYKLADELMDEIVSKVRNNQIITDGSENGYQLIDQFARQHVVWKSTGIRRHEIEPVLIENKDRKERGA